MKNILPIFKKSLLAASFLFGINSALSQNVITVPFVDGFIGVQGSNPQTAQNVSNFSTLGVEVAYFQQNSSGAIFEVQGNDIVGTVILVSSVTGQTMDVPGAIVWRVTSMGSIEVIGFIPDPANPATNLSDIGLGAYAIDASSNFGLRLNSSTYPIVDGSNISGNAATTGLLDALNAYLAEVQSNAPAGPVIADNLTTTSTTPTIGGTVTLGAGETFSVIVDGQSYDTSNGVNIVGNNWTLTLPLTPLGTYTITAVITNASFYTLTNAGTLIISACTDPDVPTLTGDFTDQCQGGNTVINIAGNLNDATEWHIYTDSCGGTSIGTTTGNAFLVSPTVTTTYYIRGEGGCVVPGVCATATVTIDSTPPVAVCQDFTAELDATGNVTITASDIDNGSSDDCSIASITLDITSFTCADLGDNTVTLTVTDSNGNTDTCTATVTVQDNINPTAVGQGITVQLDATGSATITTADIDNGSTDNCGAPTLGLDITSFGCADVGTNTVTLTATDSSNNTDSTTVTVTVEDNIDPSAVCQDITIQLDATGNASIVAADIDNGSSDNCTFTLSADITSFTAADLGDNTVTLTVTDASGNTAICTAIVTVEDSIDPTAVCQDFTVALDATGNATITAADIDNGSSDNNGLPVTLSLDIDSFDCLDLGENTVTLTVTETLPNVDLMINGSFESGDFSGWTVVENANPFLPWTVGGGGGSGSGFFPDALPIDGSFLAYNGFDGAPGEMYISQDIMVPNSGGTLNWSENIDYELASFGATQDRIYEVQIRDASNNILEVAYQRVAQAGVIDNDNVWDSHTFDMAAYAGQSIHITFWQQIPENFTGPAKFALDNVEFLAGGSVQSSTCTATVTVVDSIAPSAVGQDITVNLDASGNATITTGDIDNGSSDNCGIVNQTLDITAFTCADLGPNAVVYTVEDSSGNQDSVTVTVTVVDTIDPTVITQDITVQLDATGNATIVAADIDNGTSDNCSVVSLTLDVTSFTCADVGTNTVTLTAEDESGNTGSATATVTVEDNIAPSVLTQDITVNLDAMGMASITPADVDNGSTDNCGIDTYSLDVDTFDCDDVGPNTVTLTVVDINGNSAQASAVVTVVDVTPPVIVCAPDVVTIMDPGVCYAEVFFADAIALDECGIASVIQTAGPASGSLFTQGVTTIEYTATDVNGNTTVCSFTITIQDTQIPTIASADDIAVSNDLGVCGAFVNVPAPTITDNCSQDPAPVVDGPVTPLLGGTRLLDTPSTVSGLSNSIGGDVTAVVTYNGDWSSTVEDFDLRGPDGLQVFFRDNQGVDCPGIDFADTFTISESTWNGWITTYGSDLTFTLLADTAVNPGLCANNFYQLSFTLGNGASLVNDYNGTADASDEYPVGTTVVTWTFTDIGGNVVTDTQTITVTDDEAPEMICIGEPGTFSITEDFEAGTLPNGWTNTALRGSDLWSFGSPFYVAGLGQAFPTNAVVFDDDAAGSGTDNAVELASPVYNMNGAASATLSFDYAYNYLSPNEFFSVEVYDGTQWVEILRLLEDHVPTNTGALDMLPYANDSFQVRFTYDDGGSGWKWGVGIDNFQLDYDIPSTPLTIALDANGAATLDVSQLLLSATDNCGPVSTSIGGGAVPGSLSTIFAGGNGGADGGVVYFDLTAINDLTLESLQMHVQDPGTFTVDIYAIEGGTYVGNENNAAPWTLIGAGSGESNTTGTPSDVTLDAALSLTAGTTYAMALVLDATHSHRYTNGDGTNESFSDANMSVSLGSATSVPFTGTIFNPRVFNGTFNYFVGTPPSTTVDFDCSNLGDNLIEVTAIDSAGNVSTCISTVEVIDVTDPILVCQDATVSLDENGMAEVLPEYFIDTDASFDACGITITAVDVTDVTCADIGTPITVTVFVSDASGNIASCQATMTVVDDMGPLLVDCPEDMTVDPGAVDLFYELPDYTVGVTATDNCTDPVGVISQDPPAGTLLPDGVYTITLSATDNEGNVGSCSFELTVESVLGAASNQLSAGVEIYPNPARKVMNIGNSSNIQLERALIYDLNGRLIQSIDLGNMDREASVNVANLASGVYLVQLEAEGATAIKRLIKE